MGLFDAIFGSPEKHLLRQCKRVSNKNAQPEDREAAARWLFEDGSEQAIYGLLGRFDISIENQMKDAAEKDLVFGLLRDLGSDVVEPARTYVKRCKNIALPLRVLAEVGGPVAQLEAMLEMLDQEVQKEDYKPDRKRHLLIMLAEHRDPRVIPSVARFLDDFDEGVRYAAAEAMLAQDDDAARRPLLDALANPEEESNRLRARIGESFFARRWSLEERAGDLVASPPPSFKVWGNLLTRDQ